LCQLRRRTQAPSADVDDIVNHSPTWSKNCTGRWNIHEIVARPLRISPLPSADRNVKRMLMRMREEIGHENIAIFFGISSNDDAVYLVEQYCVISSRSTSATMAVAERNNRSTTMQ